MNDTAADIAVTRDYDSTSGPKEVPHRRSLSPTVRRDLHFDLRWLGTAHEHAEYTLHTRGRRYPLHRHTADTLASMTPAGTATHFAAQVESAADVVGLSFVTGPDTPEGFPSLASVAITTPNDSKSKVYKDKDVAQAIVFINPTVSVLTPELADTVLGHIGSTDSVSELQFAITTLGEKWCVPRGVVDEQGKPVLKPNGQQYFTYELNPGVLNTAAQVSGDSKRLIYSDETLQSARWNLLPGVSCIDMSAQSFTARAEKEVAANTNGYSVNIQDSGPNFGLSVKLNGLDENFVLDLTVTNSYIRHTSVFVSFLTPDGKAIQVPDNIWTSLLKGAALALFESWISFCKDSPLYEELITLLTNSDNTLWWLGNVGAESTFMGIPVSSTNIDFQFGIPSSQGSVGKIRLLVGSLGVNSGNDWDPTAAWLGLSMTALIDLAIPIYSLASTAGEESNSLFDSIFKDVAFLLPTAYSVFLVAKDLFTGSANTGNDLSGALISLGDALVSRVLTAADVAAKLAAYFGAEEAEEAIPFVGWGLKVLAMEASVEQLAQTIGEVIASPRVVEFDLTVTMNAQITLVPDARTGNEFPETATSFQITAQYTEGTTRTYTGTIADPKVAEIVVDWPQVPVGGSVSFVVAFYSKEGWGVGKGQSGTFSNLINGKDTNGNPAFVATVSVAQELYPLSAATTYQHSHLLTYVDGDSSQGYQWMRTSKAPTETASNLGTGPWGHALEALSGITLRVGTRNRHSDRQRMTAQAMRRKARWMSARRS